MQKKLTKQYLFCPGPVNVADNVKKAIISNEVGHREEEFSTLYRNLNSNLLKLLEIRNQEKYFAVIITGSGTAANEAVLSSAVGDKNILIISNGEFGNRLYEISTLHNQNTHLIQFQWGEKIDIKKVEDYIKIYKINFIALVHHETSVGILNPINEIGSLAKKYNLIFFVDGVSSVGAEKIDLEKYNIAFLSSSASKAIGSLAGVSFVIGKKDSFEKLEQIPPKTAYLNLFKFYYYAKEFGQTPNTPAVQLFYAFNQAINNILAEGVEKRRKRLINKALILRKGMKKLGLKFLIDEKDMSCVLTTVLFPKYIEYETLHSELKEKNIIIYNGKGPLQNRVFQVGNIGDLDKKEIIFFLKALGKILKMYKEKFLKKQLYGNQSRLIHLTQNLLHT